MKIGYSAFFRPGEYPAVLERPALVRLAILLFAFFRAFTLVFRARRYQVIWLLREAAPLGPPMLEWLYTRLLRLPIVFDIDDATWLAPGKEGRLERLVRWRTKVPWIIGVSRAVCAGNRFLGDFSRRFNQAVLEIPTSVDVEGRYAAIKAHEPSGTPTIGWTGSSSTNTYLELVANSLNALRETVTFRLIAISDKQPLAAISGLEYAPWSARDEIERLLEIDIGIMPLRDTAWEKGKCGFKLVQYMALGIPSVASDVGANRDIIRHGIDGFLCRTEDDWTTYLRRLVNDPALRAEMGRNARARAVEKFSIQAHVKALESLFEAAARGLSPGSSG